MLAPHTTQRARDAAGHHVRLQVVRIDAPPGFDGGPCEVDTTVERVFRTRTDVKVGQGMRLRVFCFVPPDGQPTGPTWLDFHALSPGTRLEAFVDASGDGQYAVVMFQIAITHASGDAADDRLWGSAKCPDLEL